MAVKRQTAISVFWVGVATVVTKAFSALQMLILAKLLLPADFGLVQVAFLGIAALELFRELGFGSALIYRRDDLEKAADTAFTAIVLSSALLYLVALFAAEPLMSLVSKDASSVAQAVPVLRVLALTMVISSIGQVPTILLAKDLNFRRKIVPEMVGALGGAILSITLAVARLGVWSLVSGYLFEATLAATVIWFVCPWRPRWRFHWQTAREMFSYGKSIVGSHMLVFLITNTDDAFVSKLLGPTQLGYYGFAYKTSNLPATQITRLVGQVTFPAFSKVQDNLEILRDIYLKTTRYASLVAVPAAICIIAFASDFINGVYGKTWAPAILPLQLLGVYGLMRSIAANMGNVFKAGGKPHWLVGIAILRLAVMVIGLYPATRYYGIVGVSALSAVVAVLDFFLSMVLTNRLVGLPTGDFLRMLLPIFTNSLIAVTAAKLVYPYLFFDLAWRRPVIIALPLAGLVMFGVYGLLTWLIDAEFRNLARSSWREGQQRGREWLSRLSAKWQGKEAI